MGRFKQPVEHVKKQKLHPDMEANKWLPGQSGNPAGRPKGVQTFANILNKIGLQDAPPEMESKLRAIFPEAQRLTMKHVVCYRAYLDAVKGDSRAMDFLADRMEGKVAMRITGDSDGDPIVIRHED